MDNLRNGGAPSGNRSCLLFHVLVLVNPSHVESALIRDYNGNGWGGGCSSSVSLQGPAAGLRDWIACL